MQQKIEITIDLPDLTLPKTLTKKAEIKVDLKNINNTGVVLILSQVLHNAINQMVVEQQEILVSNHDINLKT